MLKGGIPSRFDTTGVLNSCGNSDASSDDNLSGDEFVVSGWGGIPVHVIPLQEPTPTSVFKVYNSSRDPLHGAPTMDIFSWARLQLVSHDHSYYNMSSHDNTSLIDHGSICVENVRWWVDHVIRYVIVGEHTGGHLNCQTTIMLYTSC